MIQLGFLSSYGDAGLLVLRVILGFIMLVHGAPKLFGPARPMMRGGMSQLGIPTVLFDLVGVLEFLGGILLILGLMTRLLSILFVLEMLGTISLYIGKLGKMVPPPEMLHQMVSQSRRFMRGFIAGVGGWELDLLVLGVALLLFLLGPGSLSVDALIRIF